MLINVSSQILPVCLVVIISLIEQGKTWVRKDGKSTHFLDFCLLYYTGKIMDFSILVMTVYTADSFLKKSKIWEVLEFKPHLITVPFSLIFKTQLIYIRVCWWMNYFIIIIVGYLANSSTLKKKKNNNNTKQKNK